MPWIKFSDHKPKAGVFLITRSSGIMKGDNSFENWRTWNKQYLDIKPHPPSHWWQGPDDFDLAIKSWTKLVTLEASSF